MEYPFTATIDVYDFQKYVYTCIYIPEAVIAQLPLDTYPRLRVNALIDAQAATGALMPDRVGSNQTRHLLKAGYPKDERVWYLQVPKKLLNHIQKAVGDRVDVVLTIADQAEVAIHPDVEELLANDDALREIWERLTPGKQRSLMYPILAAKTDRTREKRIAALTDQLADL